MPLRMCVPQLQGHCLLHVEDVRSIGAADNRASGVDGLRWFCWTIIELTVLAWRRAWQLERAGIRMTTGVYREGTTTMMWPERRR